MSSGPVSVGLWDKMLTYKCGLIKFTNNWVYAIRLINNHRPSLSVESGDKQTLLSSMYTASSLLYSDALDVVSASIFMTCFCELEGILDWKFWYTIYWKQSTTQPYNSHKPTDYYLKVSTAPSVSTALQ